jgi:hypothetical protein
VGDTVSTALTVAVLAFIGWRLLGGARYARSRDGRALAVEVVRRIRWRHLWPVPLVLGAVIALASALLLVPGLDWGWWTALGGNGNPVFGSSASTSGTVLEWLIPLVFVCLLVPALPLFAFSEERIFREGAEEWDRKRRVVKVLQFGMAHALIGIPIGVALALSVGGAYFMAVYLRAFRACGDRRQATLESTRAHTAYNATILVVVLVVVVWGAAQ